VANRPRERTIAREAREKKNLLFAAIKTFCFCGIFPIFLREPHFWEKLFIKRNL
jgi:hypothetical protein